MRTPTVRRGLDFPVRKSTHCLGIALLACRISVYCIPTQVHQNPDVQDQMNVAGDEDFTAGNTSHNSQLILIQPVL